MFAGMIDLRSDTVTRPTAAMRQAMANAEVGDDVFGEDPSAIALQAEVAKVCGKEAALFVSSGTMSNQLAIAVQTRPGDEVIASDGAHVIWYETGGAAALSGVQLSAAGTGGLFTADEMEAQMKPAAYWSPRTSLVCVENTHNRAGGRIFPQSDIRVIAERARVHGLALHLDGARIWNASVATGLTVAELAAPFDTISVCFSKGLCAPAGSALVGPRALIERAHRLRKMWGGGMRQVGVLAAAARFALANHRERMVDDHTNAKLLAERMGKVPGAHVDALRVESNIVNIDLDAPLTGEGVAGIARTMGLAINASGPRRLRAVTHLDVTRADVEKGTELLAEAIARASGEK